MLGETDDGVQPLGCHWGGFVTAATRMWPVGGSALPKWDRGTGKAPLLVQWCAVAPEHSLKTEVGIVLPQLQVQ